MKFISFFLQRIGRILAVLLGVSLLTFGLVHAIPGSPWNNYSTEARAMSNLGMDEATLRELNRHFGLDQPLWRQFTRYLIGDWDKNGDFTCGAVCGNLGPSISQRGRSVQSVFFSPPRGKGAWDSQFGYSLRLVLLGSVFALGVGIPAGLFSALRPNHPLSRAITYGLTGLASIPNFILGLLAVIVLATGLHWIKVLPDWHNPGHWIVPALVLAALPMTSLARMTRATVRSILGEAYIRAARAKGVPARLVLWRHALRNALAPLVTYSGPLLVEMFSGLFVVESLYSFPGLGRQFWDAVLKLDYPLILGLTLFYATILALINLLSELLNEALDPRIRANQQRGDL
jgi:oligopeptide transport system permease protein